MALRFWPVFLLLALAVVAESTTFGTDTKWALAADFSGGISVGDVIDVNEEMMMGSEASRRGLAQATKYISYGALKKNSVPCSRRGQSYYNCGISARANPYRRGCSAITRCARMTG